MTREESIERVTGHLGLLLGGLLGLWLVGAVANCKTPAPASVPPTTSVPQTWSTRSMAPVDASSVAVARQCVANTKVAEEDRRLFTLEGDDLS
jgi:hypothetical protein